MCVFLGDHNWHSLIDIQALLGQLKTKPQEQQDEEEEGVSQTLCLEVDFNHMLSSIQFQVALLVFWVLVLSGRHGRTWVWDHIYRTV